MSATLPARRWHALRLACAFPLVLVLLTCGGGGGGTPGSGAGPASLAYAENPGLYRAGETIPPNTPQLSGGTSAVFTVFPPLPAGIVLDPQTGVISGAPVTGSSGTYLVMAANSFGTVEVGLTIVVGPPLPAALTSLAPGFMAETVAQGLAKPVKLAPAPDGRIFFAELETGNIRIVDAFGILLSQPFATVPVMTGGHRGLLGLALDPSFATTGRLYVMACLPASGGHSDRSAVLRYTDDGSGFASLPETVVDDLPVSVINNGGEILFDATGCLLASVGDVQDPSLAQAGAALSLAGKILRYVPAVPALIPTDPLQPIPGSPEWCRGLRNTFGLAVHPVTGGIFGVDNGPDSHDELNFLAPGRNFEWGAVAEVGLPGFRIRDWPDVIVPTALAWHDGRGIYAPYFADNLFLTSYDDQALRRFVMTGPVLADIESEELFASFGEQGIDHKPLDVEVAVDGSLLVSTFTAIYRILRLA